MFAYWHYAEIYPSTDNAYTGADVVRVASQVSAPVARVYVQDDDNVAAGDPLFDIDPTLYDAALRNARAQFDAAASAAGTAGDALKAAATKLEEKGTALEAALATYRKAKDAQKEVSPATSEITTALKSWHDAWAAFDAAEADFAKAQDDKLTVTTPTVQLRAASAQLDKATHDRVQTHVTAPAAGWVSNVSLRPGAIVQAGAPAFAIIEDGRWWVDANFKETDLARIRTGQNAKRKSRHVSRAQARRRRGEHQRRLRRELLGAAAGERDAATGSRSPSAFRCASGSPARHARQAAPLGIERQCDHRHHRSRRQDQK